jgi:hypothetical protein
MPQVPRLAVGYDGSVCDSIYTVLHEASGDAPDDTRPITPKVTTPIKCTSGKFVVDLKLHRWYEPKDQDPEMQDPRVGEFLVEAVYYLPKYDGGMGFWA